MRRARRREGDNVLKLMLVDDNRLALEYFASLVSWEAEGFELVCTAGDGEAALIFFDKYSPDVVITDVQMPNLDGIGLAREIRNRAPQTMVLFLSSYEEFSYIRSAMELGVYDYILKHELTAETLRAKLRKLRSTMEKRNVDKRFIAEGSLSSWLNNQRDGLPRESAKLTSRFPGRYDFTLAMEDCILPGLARRYSPTTEDNMGAVRAFLYGDPSTEAVLQIDAHTLLVVSSAGQGSLSRAYRWRDEFRSESIHSLSFLLTGEECTVIDGITQYLAVESLRNQKYFYPAGTVLTASMLRRQTSNVKPLCDNDLSSLLDAHRFSDSCRLLDEQYIRIQQNADSDAFQNLCEVCCNVMSAQNNSLWDPSARVVFTMFDPVSDPPRWYDIPSAFCWLKERYTFMTGLMDTSDRRSRGQGTGKVLSYIQAHYSDSNLGAEAIAEAFGVSVNRMNAMIKKETGSTLWKLLIQVRMEEAGRLLRTSSLPVSDIMEKTGYRTMSHFADSFRKYYDMSPSEYRRLKNEEF